MVTPMDKKSNFPGCEPESRFPDVRSFGMAVAAYGKEHGLTPRQLEDIFNAGLLALAELDWIPRVTDPELLARLNGQSGINSSSDTGASHT